MHIRSSNSMASSCWGLGGKLYIKFPRYFSILYHVFALPFWNKMPAWHSLEAQGIFCTSERSRLLNFFIEKCPGKIVPAKSTPKSPVITPPTPCQESTALFLWVFLTSVLLQSLLTQPHPWEEEVWPWVAAEPWGERRDVGTIFPSHQQLAGCMISHHSCSHLENCQQEDLSSRLRAAPACQSTRLTTSWQRWLLQSGALTLPQETAHTGCCLQSHRCPQGDATGPCALGLCPW